MTGDLIDPALVHAEGSAVFHRELNRGYPLIDRGEGMWLIDAEGNRYLDAVGGGAMVSSIGAGIAEIAGAAHRQLERIGFLYNQQFTSAAQETLARELIALAPGFARVHFASGGAEANETLLRLARAYHVERGEPGRWNVVSFAQAYHGRSSTQSTTTAQTRSPHSSARRCPQRRCPPSAPLTHSGEGWTSSADGTASSSAWTRW